MTSNPTPFADRACHGHRRSTAGEPSLHPSAMPGRWSVDAAASFLQISVTVGFLATVTGRFTDVRGDLEVAGDAVSSSIRVSVASDSLTSGSSHWDRVLRDAGLIDVRANPTVSFRSSALRPSGTAWTLDGVLRTARGTLPVAFDLRCLSASVDRLRCRATGSLRSSDAVRLLSRPGLDRLIGRVMTVDLTVDAVPTG